MATKYRVTEIIKRYGLLMSQPGLQACATREPPTPEQFAAWVTELRRAMPGSATEEVVRASLIDLGRLPITRRSTIAAAWRLAGNIDKLRVGEPIRPWDGQRNSDPVPVMFTDSLPTRTKYGKVGSTYSALVIGGEAAGMTARGFFTRKFVRWASKFLGWGKTRDAIRIAKDSELVGMYALAVLKQGETRLPALEKLQPPSGSLLKHNKSLIKKRARDGFACPQSYTHPCYACHIGYDGCVAAVHSSTYTARQCDECGQLSLFDPSQNSEFCIRCLVSMRMRGGNDGRAKSDA